MTTVETPRTLKQLREQYTMPIGQVAEAFGMPKETLRARIARGEITLGARRFGANTSPFLYDPAEVDAEVIAYAARVEAAAQ